MFLALTTLIVLAPGANATQSLIIPPRCHDTQLAVAAESSMGAGGSDGSVVLIANHSRSACSLDGYARVSFVSSTGREIRATTRHRGSMLYATVSPHRVSLAPNAVASFAVSYEEEFVPPTDAPSACLAQTMYVVLPSVHPRFYPNGMLAVPVSIDLCLSDWIIGLTPIEAGAQVKGA